MILILTEKREAGCDMGAVLGDSKLGSDAVKLNELGKRQGFIEGEKYAISWAAGHLFQDLSPKEINEKYSLYKRFENKDDYKMPQLLGQMKVKPTDDSYKQKQRDIIKQYLTRSDIEQIIIATDADGEGEAIGRDLIFQLEPNISKPIKRFWNTGSFKTKESVENAMSNLLPFNIPKYEALYNSRQARSLCDYLIGMKLTKTLVDNYNKPFYIGRVKAVVLSLVGNRELDIKDFTPKSFYSLVGKLDELVLEHFYKEEVEDFDNDGNIVTKELKQKNYYTKPKIQTVVDECNNVNLTGVVEKNDITTTTTKSRPLPLSGTDFASEMMGKYKIKYAECNEILDYLRSNGFTTYPGTNGRYFAKADSDEVVKAFNTAVKYFNIDNANYTTTCQIFDDKKAAKQNHTPLSITSKVPTPTDIEKWEKEKLPNIKEAYELIAKRILVHFLPNDELQKQHFLINIAGHKFETTGQKALNQGWREFIDMQIKDSTFNSTCKVGDSVKIGKLDLKEGKTKCPSFYTVKTLLDTMLNVSKVLDDEIKQTDDPDTIKRLKQVKKSLKNAEGIGTDRTREQIINDLIDNAMMNTEGKESTLKLTPAGWELYQVVPPALKDVSLTGNWENAFESIRREEILYTDFINEVDNFIMQTMIPSIFDNLGKKVSVQQQRKEIDFTCPLCKKYLKEWDQTFSCTRECGFVIFKNQSKSFGRTLNQNDLKEILSSTKTNPLQTPLNHHVYLDLDNKYFLTTTWNNNYSSNPNELIETPKTFRKGDKFIFKVVRGKTLTTVEAQKLLDDKAIKLRLKNKAGQPYEMRAKMGENGNVNLNFIQNQNED